MKNKTRKTGDVLSRRDFIRIGAGTGMILSMPALAAERIGKLAKPVKLGLITDLHHDIMHDAPGRLDAFLTHSKAANVDGVMQIGDFAYPSEKNKPVIDRFNQAHATRLHVIGNHDTDSGHTKQQCIDNWGMPDRYYVRQINGIWFIVLDGNDKGSPTHKGGYPAYINPGQTAWLKSKLAEINGPVVIVSHQPLAGALAIDNAAELQEILARAADKVVLAINGHTHVDSLIYDNGIPYLTINSASYFWIGDKYAHESYPEEIHQSHKWISRTCPYKDPLFTVMTIDPVTLTIQVSATQSQWVGKSPTELGFTDDYKPLRVGQEITPAIRPRVISARKR